MESGSSMIVEIKESDEEVINININTKNTIQNLGSKIQEEAESSVDISQVIAKVLKIRNEKKNLNYVSSASDLRRSASLQAKKNDMESIQYPLSCIVLGCNSVKSASQDKSFYTLPTGQECRLRWLVACNREDLLESMELNLAVCSDHFTSEQLSKLSSKALKDDVTPSVFSLNHNFSSEDEDDVKSGNMFEESNSRFIDTTQIKLEPDINSYLDDFSENEDTDVTGIKHPGQLCRLCANNARDVIYIFSTTGKELNIEDKINSSLPISVQKTDPLPKQLCSSCVLKLDMCYQFSQSCIMAEEKLKSLMKLKRFWSYSPRESLPSYLPDKELNQNYIMEPKAEVVNEKSSDFNFKQRPLSEVLNRHKIITTGEEINNSYCCPLCCEGKMIVQNISDTQSSMETDDKTDTLSYSNMQLIELKDSCDNDKMKDLPGKLGVDMNNLQSNVVYEVRDEKGNNFTLVESNIGWWHDQNTFENAEIIIETLNPQDSLLRDMDDGDDNDVAVDNWNLSNEVKEDVASLACQFCGKVFSSIEQCLDHSKVHGEDGCYPCSLCGMLFNTELDITSHCEEHKTDYKKTTSKISRGRITCNKCGRRFNSERTLNEHSCGTTESKQFRCEICKKAYISEERLAFHNKFHEGARPNYCDQCGKEFDNEGSLYYHTKMVHEGVRPFCCEECGKRFYSKARLESHKRVHSGERPFECEVCCRRFYDRETLKGHYITHMSDKPFQCDLCGVCCGRKSMLKQHMQKHHSDSYMPKRFPSLIHYFCKICNKTFTSSSEVLTHRTTHWATIQTADSENKEQKSHVCEFCGESFALINLHRKQEHPNEQPYVCSICKETSRTLYEARAHRKTHTKVDPDHKEKVKTEQGNSPSENVFICEECGKPLPGRRRFLAHMKTHHMDLPIVCTVCGRKFTEKQRLIVHMRLHTGEKPYSCNECGKRFTQSSALYTHVLLHTGEKPHACDLCGKAFRIKADRDNHRRTHTGEKPYRCEFCSKQFRTGQVYYQHRMIHTGERRFPCDICGKAFRRSHTLVVHKRIHTGEKPNICDICGRGFRQRTDMRKHRALHE